MRPSRTNPDGIETSKRVARHAPAGKIANFHRLLERLESLYGDDLETIHRALTTPVDGKSAFDYLLENNYPKAATAAQKAIHPPRRFNVIQGQRFPDAVMVAVEDI